MTEFSWDDVYARRRVLAAEIQARLGLSFGFMVKKRFDLPSLGLADQQVWSVPFYAVAERLVDATEHGNIIDHAWWLLSADGVGEPWGFVTEPYSSMAETQRLAQLVGEQCADWWIRIEALPKERSAWYPGHCTPLVVTVERDVDLDSFLKLGIGDALARL